MIPARVQYEHRWDKTTKKALVYLWTGLPVTSNGLVAHRMRKFPTMTVLAERSEHRNVQLCAQCLLCWTGPERAQQLWKCPVQSHEWPGTASICG